MRERPTLNNVTHEYIFSDGTKCDSSSTKVIHHFDSDFDPEDALDFKGERDERYKDNFVLRAYTKYEWAISSHWGTFLHEIMEGYVMGKVSRVDFDDLPIDVPPEVYSCIKYIKNIDREEWEIIPEYTTFYEQDGVRIGGQIDLLLRNWHDRDLYSIRDWKFTKKLSKTGYPRLVEGVMTNKLAAPLDKLVASKKNKYSLQIAEYEQMILQDNPNARFVDNQLLHSNPPYFCPYKGDVEHEFTVIKPRKLEKEVKAMLSAYVKYKNELHESTTLQVNKAEKV